jgi:PilZ domain
LEAQWPAMMTQSVDLRQHPRVKISWPVTVEVRNARFEGRTIDVSSMGAKVSLEQPVTVGTPARLLLRPPNDAPLEVDAIVWRTDQDGPAFFFLGVDIADVSPRR